MKINLVVLFSLISPLCLANMASPILEGTHASTAISSRNIDILKEVIRLSLNENFTKATYHITYHIRTDSAGRQIPLLFLAEDYRDGFSVMVDGQPVPLLDMRGGVQTTTDSAFLAFAEVFEPAEGGNETVSIQWQKYLSSNYRLNDLKYFEVDLDRGEHLISVEYAAGAWTDISDWVTRYSFRYALSPARYWRSFGTLEIQVDATAFDSRVNSSLGSPHEGNLTNKATWTFSELPADFFEITYQPKISQLASLLIVIGPFGLSLIMSVFLIIFHYWLMKRFRKRYPQKQYSPALILGSLAVPLLFFILYIEAFALIDLVIGPAAGEYHGYTFLAIIFYPVVLFFYWLIMWRVDKGLKERLGE
jgi:hypothetical protein